MGDKTFDASINQCTGARNCSRTEDGNGLHCIAFIPSPSLSQSVAPVA